MSQNYKMKANSADPYQMPLTAVSNPSPPCVCSGLTVPILRVNMAYILYQVTRTDTGLSAQASNSFDNAHFFMLKHS